MKLADWAPTQGIAYKTAWTWFRDGTLPVPARQLSTGTILVDPERAPATEAVALYARVSGSGQKADLERQLGRLADHAGRNRLTVVKAVAEVGSGLNGRRPKLMALLADPIDSNAVDPVRQEPVARKARPVGVTAIVVEHKDRLARFGAEHLEAALAASGRKLIVVNEGEAQDDLVQDMLDVLTGFCARLYGRRSAKLRAQAAVAAAGQAPARADADDVAADRAA